MAGCGTPPPVAQRERKNREDGLSLTLSFQEHGAGAPVVVLHGLFGSARNWTSIAKRLGETRHVFALDLRNHGDSPWDGDVGFAAMAGDVRAFIEGHGLMRPVVIGHSLGGKVAMTLALTHPETIGGLVAVDIAPVAYRGSFLDYIDAMRGMDLSAVARRADADALLADVVPDAGVRAFLLQNLELNDAPRWRINLDGLAAGMDEMGGFPDFGADRAYAGRTLFLGGGKSDYLRPEHAATIRRLFPNATIETIDGAGHWVHAERPDDFIARVTAFLDAVRAEQEA